MLRARSVLVSSCFLLATGMSVLGDVDPKIQPNLRSSASTRPIVDDLRRTEKAKPGLNKFLNPPSADRAGPVDRKVLLAQTRLPSLKEINLLAANEGGQAIVVPNDGWFKPISGKESDYATVYPGQEAVYAFKDEKPAVFSKFSVLITGESQANPKQIEVLVADDSPTGTFRSVGKLTTVNAKLVKSPYQELSFSETRAKYVKIKILATHGWNEMSLGQIRLLGTPVE